MCCFTFVLLNLAVLDIDNKNSRDLDDNKKDGEDDVSGHETNRFILCPAKSKRDTNIVTAPIPIN